MDRFFRLSERGSSPRTEVVAGLTTFMTMAYIVFVNPTILGTEGTGLPVGGVFVATCLAAVAAGVAMGASGVTSYIENGSGITEGDRTGATSVMVGFLMMTVVRFVTWEEADEAIPAFLTILTLSLTFNISYGIGFVSYVPIKLARGRPGEVRPLLYVMAVLFAPVYSGLAA